MPEEVVYSLMTALPQDWTLGPEKSPDTIIAIDVVKSPVTTSLQKN